MHHRLSLTFKLCIFFYLLNFLVEICTCLCWLPLHRGPLGSWMGRVCHPYLSQAPGIVTCLEKPPPAKGWGPAEALLRSRHCIGTVFGAPRLSARPDLPVSMASPRLHASALLTTLAECAEPGQAFPCIPPSLALGPDCFHYPFRGPLPHCNLSRPKHLPAA